MPRFSNRVANVPDLAVHHNDVESALRTYFNASAPPDTARFTGYLPQEVVEELQERLNELDLTSSLTI